jgi:hypothetical protein
MEIEELRTEKEAKLSKAAFGIEGMRDPMRGGRAWNAGRPGTNSAISVRGQSKKARMSTSYVIYLA